MQSPRPVVPLLKISRKSVFIEYASQGHCYIPLPLKRTFPHPPTSTVQDRRKEKASICPKFRGSHPQPPRGERGRGKTLISKLQVVLPGYYLLCVGCQGFPEPAKTQPLPQGLQSLRQTNNTQPRHEIRPTEELGANSGIGAMLLSGSPLVPKSLGERTNIQGRSYIRKEWALRRNERGCKGRSPGTG